MVNNIKNIKTLALFLCFNLYNPSHGMQSASASLASKAATHIISQGKNCLASGQSAIEAIAQKTNTVEQVNSTTNWLGRSISDDFSWTVANAEYVLTNAAYGTPALAAGACAAYAAQKVYKNQQEQKLLSGPQTFYQLSQLYDDPLLLDDGKDKKNTSNNDTNKKSSFFAKYYKRFKWSMMLYSAYLLGKKYNDAQQPQLNENKIEQLIDFMQKPDRKVFGSAGNEYVMMDTKYHGRISYKCIRPNTLESYSDYQYYENPNYYVKMSYNTYPTYPDTGTTPESIIFHPKAFLDSDKPQDLLAQASREVNRQADKNEQEYDYIYNELTQDQKECGLKPKPYYPVDAGKHGIYQCYKNFRHSSDVHEISCLGPKDFEEKTKSSWFIPFTRVLKNPNI